MSRAARPRRAPDARRCKLALIHQAAKALGMDDDTRRALQREATGRASAADMNPQQLDAVIERLRALGFKPAARIGAVADYKKKRVAKIRAMWIQLADEGVVRNRSDAAIIKFAARITRAARLEWSDDAGLAGVINALQAMAAQHGVQLREPGREPERA